MQLPKDVAATTFRACNQPEQDLLPLPFKGIFVGTPPTQHSFSPLLLSVQEGQALRPPGGNIGERQGVQVAALDIGATMSHQVCFQKAGSGLIPLLEGADRNLLLEQGSRSRGGKAMLTSFALRGQQAIGRF